jgi:hypothetical protein
MIGNSTNAAALSSVVTIFKRRSSDFNVDEHDSFPYVVLKIRRTIKAKKKKNRELISILVE